VAGITLTLATALTALQRVFSRGGFHIIRPAIAAGAVFPCEHPLRAVFENERQLAVAGNIDGGDFRLKPPGVVLSKPQTLGAFLKKDVLPYRFRGTLVFPR